MVKVVRLRFGKVKQVEDVKHMKIAYEIDLLTVNQAWAGRRFKTPKYKGYEEELLLRLPKKPMVKGKVQVNYTFYVKNMARDTSNMIKPLEDIIVKRGYIEDDRKVITMAATKIKSDIERFEIEIIPL